MSLDYVRGIVSGKKARYVDPDHSVDLDLVYVTDRIIIMGWPASGWAGNYRNRKSDVLRFLDKRHKDKYWVWNLCPLYENAYSSDSMHNRVSRYPFPDHHPPPLQLLPLAVREMRAWLAGDSERIAIIHCKAGKGRSGTLLCSYMLSLPELPGPPGSEMSYSKPDRAGLADSERKSEGWIAVGHGNNVSEIQVSSTSLATDSLGVPTNTNLTRSESSATTISATDSSASIEVQSYQPIDIGDEPAIASSGQYDRRDGKVDSVFKLHSSRRMKPSSTGRGVSIPSQRRWCRYVNLLFSDRAPSSYGDTSAKIRIKSMTLFLHPPSGWQKPLAKLVTGTDAGQGKAWVSVARYDDEYVRELAAKGAKGEEEVTWGGVGGDGNFDTKKMFRSCGKLIAVDNSSASSNENKELVEHYVEPIEDLVLERGREFRMKFHLGSIPLAWAWMIPAFHLPEPTSPRKHTLRFPKSQIDFAVGPGSSIHHIDVCLEEMEDGEGQRTGAAPLLDEKQEKEEGMDDTRGEKVKEDGE